MRSEVPRHEHAAGEHGGYEASALLVLGKGAEAKRLEEHAKLRLDRIDAEEQLIG